MIVDTHVHVVASDQKKYPLQSPPASVYKPHAGSWFLEAPVTVEQLRQRMDEAGVERTVLVQPISAYYYDNNYAADSALRYPERFVSVCIIDTLSPEAAGRLSYWIRERGMSGLRISSGGRAEGILLDDPRSYPVWELAASLRIPVCIQMLLRDIPQLSRLLKRFPTVPVALDHMAQFGVEKTPSEEEAKEFFDLVRFPNLYLKFSPINYGTKAVVPAFPELFKRLVERFGARRLMWGSNYSATHNRTYKELVDIGRQVVSFLPAEDQKWLLGETALSLWPALRK